VSLQLPFALYPLIRMTRQTTDGAVCESAADPGAGVGLFVVISGANAWLILQMVV
jgi:manganese transport protein